MKAFTNKNFSDFDSEKNSQLVLLRSNGEPACLVLLISFQNNLWDGDSALLEVVVKVRQGMANHDLKYHTPQPKQQHFQAIDDNDVYRPQPRQFQRNPTKNNRQLQLCQLRLLQQ